MINAPTFKNLVSRFPTGVAVVVASGSDFKPRGCTVSAFLPVSLDPPLVLVSLHRESETLSAIEYAGAFSVNVLRDDQERVARRFASGDHASRFADTVVVYSNSSEVPALLDSLASLIVRVAYRVAAGDHALVVGELVGGRVRDGEPLAHCGSEFRCVRPL